MDELVSVRRRGRAASSDMGWLYGTTIDGRQGWFPSGAVEPVCREVVQAFDGAEKAGYLKLSPGERLIVLYRGSYATQDSEWAYGSTVDRRRSGWFPTRVASEGTRQVWIWHRRARVDEEGPDASRLRLAPAGELMVGGSCKSALLGGARVQVQRYEGAWALVCVPLNAQYPGWVRGWVSISHLHAKDPGPAGAAASRPTRAPPT